MSENIINWQFSFIEVVGIWVICYFASMFAIGTINALDRWRKQKMLQDFLFHIQQKVQTEEEFQNIIEQMRRDFGGGPNNNRNN